MIDPAEIARRTVAVAGRVNDVLAAHEVPAAVIGAIAAAAHGYSRDTRDFDIATEVDPFTKLREVAEAIGALGFRVEFREPDPRDPLGGVIDVRGKGFRPVQVVNFLNPLAGPTTRLGGEAIATALEGLIAESRLRVVDLPHLIALKLYAGGRKGVNDICELLERNRHLDLEPVRDVCRRHGLEKALEKVLAEFENE